MGAAIRGFFGESPSVDCYGVNLAFAEGRGGRATFNPTGVSGHGASRPATYPPYESSPD